MLRLGIDSEKLYRATFNARTAYVVAIWPSFLFDSFVKLWATCEIFLGKWFTAPLPPPPPGKKIPVRLCSQLADKSILWYNGRRAEQPGLMHAPGVARILQRKI